jgi:hypothetical protein
MQKKVYLAGPDVFMKGELSPGGVKKAACRQFGLEPVYPLDNDIPGLAEMSPEVARMAIFLANLEMLDDADVVLANLTPYEGVGQIRGLCGKSALPIAGVFPSTAIWVLRRHVLRERSSIAPCLAFLIRIL